MGREGVEMMEVTVKIVDESERMKGEMVGVREEGEGAVVVRKRKGAIALEEERLESEDLRTSGFEASKGGWVETDPETTQSFKRRQQVRFHFLAFDSDIVRVPAEKRENMKFPKTLLILTLFN